MKIEEIEKIENESGNGDCVRGNLCTTTPGGKSNNLNAPRHSFSTEQDWCSTNSRTQQNKFWQ